MNLLAASKALLFAQCRDKQAIAYLLTIAALKMFPQPVRHPLGPQFHTRQCNLHSISMTQTLTDLRRQIGDMTNPIKDISSNILHHVITSRVINNVSDENALKPIFENVGSFH